MVLDFGTNLKKLRLSKNMTQDELAQQLALSVQQISRYETGAAYPDIEMLPVIAGYFNTTIDELLGVSRIAKQKRLDEYTHKLRTVSDRKERLKILKREHAEFPGNWDIVSDMVYEMSHLPEYIDEMRSIVNDAMISCNDILWRENMMQFYLKAEPDEEKACAFMDKWCSKYDMRKPNCMIQRYSMRGDTERYNRVYQFQHCERLQSALLDLTRRNNGSIQESCNNCNLVLDFIDSLSNSCDREKPDMWYDLKSRIMLHLSNNYFALSQNDKGFAVLEIALKLYENFFSLSDGTLLSYNNPNFKLLDARTEKNVFYGLTEFSGPIASSIMIQLTYTTPVAYTNVKGEFIYDMEDFESKTVFSSHFYDVLNNADWDGFALAKKDQRFKACLERAKKVSSLENIDNLLFLMEKQAGRTDEWISDKKTVTALLVPNVGAYTVFGDDGECGIDAIVTRMKQENNTCISHIVACEVGGGILPPSKALVNAVIKLDKANENAKVILRQKGNKISLSNILEHI